MAIEAAMREAINKSSFEPLAGIPFTDAMAAYDRMNGQWWIVDGPMPGGQKVLGPYGSQDLAIKARGALEEVNAPQTFYLFTEVEITGSAEAMEER